ncbi:MAG: S8 family serine peptidase [Catenulispora sp.]|nr:S8 family serine peptidase [Catenulispora sp.]
MVRRTLRTAAVATLAAGCFLSSVPGASALGSGAPPQGTDRCPQALPAPNLSAGDVDKDLLWPESKLGLGSAGVWYLSRGKGVTVAVIDTGIDKTSPVFGPDTVMSGPSVVDRGDSADYDCDGHGTAVAALVAGNDTGIAGFSGVAPDATILPIRQTYHTAEPGSSVLLADAIRTATAAGARVVNISIATTEDSPELRSAVQDALARDVVVVAAAGTGGPAPNTAQQNVKYFPAALPGVLAVGSVDRDGDVSPFAKEDGVVLAAPGGRMAVPAAGYPGALTARQGTGFASAFVAGTAALVLAYRPNLHNWQVVQRLEVTADRPASGVTGASVGWGVVNPYRAVSTVLSDEGRRPDPSVGPGYWVVPATSAVPGHDRGTEQLVLGVAGGGLLVLAVPVVTAALRRGRARGTRAGA